MNLTSLESPYEVVAPGSRYYIERIPVEALIREEITKGGSITRIKASQKMGKTSLVLRLLADARNIGYRTIYIDLQQADENSFASLEKFLLWFCANVTQQLQLPLMLDEYWNEYTGNKVSCTVYFKEYLLQQINSPIVLTLNELNRLFDYPDIAQDFLSLLRSWYEEAKQNDVFKKMRFLLVHSTEVYARLNINQSPFNVGLAIKLPEFTTEQIQALALEHGLNWYDKLGKRYAFEIKSMLGGHPYLVRLALYYLANRKIINFEDFLSKAPTNTGIYSGHLRSLLVILQGRPELATALQNLINAGGQLDIDHIVENQLESLGIVKLDGYQCSFSCELYRKYFSNQNLQESSTWQYAKKLQKENLLLKYLSYVDDLTQLQNKRYFDLLLDELWLMVAEDDDPISIILLDIDYLKIYNRTYGSEAGDNCLREVACVIREVINDFYVSGTYLITAARYEGGNFALLLPGRTYATAFQLAETIRQKVKGLGLYHNNKLVGFPASVITASLAIASAIPNNEVSPEMLMQEAQKLLESSKKSGRDCTLVSTINYNIS
ncbi:MAG: AAA-like domain-containing protein [Scytonematopsis contorta HA4267-MV1]|jgi:diguanylate cyclase (GGDEF)-like protein|nr:AAA-like domain-containing protein [Scytonematopsis contorta HA4267-MV1]